MSENWVREPRFEGHSASEGYIENLDGVFFEDAPIPPRWHRCRPQTVTVDSTATSYRCACGAMKVAGVHGWAYRNSRRKAAR